MKSEDEDLICETCGCHVHPCLPCEEVVMLNGNHTDDTYNNLLKIILTEGKRKKNRTGVDTIGVFGAQAKFDIDLNAFPILTTKKVWFKGIVHELLWFIKGDTNIKYLVDNDVHIWDEWAYKKYLDVTCTNGLPMDPMTMETFIRRIKSEDGFALKWGELGEGTYGGMWRAFPYLHKETVAFDTFPDTIFVREQYVDQLQKVVDKLKTNPDDRRMIVNAWHPYWVDHCALPPCHVLFHFNTEELTWEERIELLRKVHGDYHVYDANEGDMKKYNIPERRLNCLLYQRSCDTFLGVPFNITSYCLLTAMIAHCVNMVPGVFTHTYGDLHIYENHIEQVKEQLSRTPRLSPALWLNPEVRNLFDFKFEDINLKGYNPHPAIKAPIAV